MTVQVYDSFSRFRKNAGGVEFSVSWIFPLFLQHLHTMSGHLEDLIRAIMFPTLGFSCYVDDCTASFVSY